MFVDMLQYLDKYTLSPVLRKRALQAYLIFLIREERYFEANEIFEIIESIEVTDQDILDEMLFSPEYFF